MLSNFVVMRTNHGAPRASADLFSSRGLRFVSSPFVAVVAFCYDPRLNYHRPLATTRQYDAAEEDEEGDPDLWYGNKRRALWKTACTRAALDSRLSSAERALYAALAPSVQTSAVLKSSCRTWEDALWATISVLCEERQSEALAWLGGGFWGPSGRELGGGNVGELEGDAEEEEDAWRADVEQELQTLAAVQVQEGLGADNPFHISQLHIILDRTDALLDDFASRLRDGAYDPESSECVLLLPFRHDLKISLSIILGIRR
jgi:nuclear pore complex protein Nup107